MYETKGTPTTCMCLQNRCKNFEVGKKSVLCNTCRVANTKKYDHVLTSNSTNTKHISGK